MGDGHDRAAEIARLQAEIAALRSRVADRDAAAELGMLFDHMFEGIQIIDRDFRYVYLNRTAAEHGRRPVAELVGRRMEEAYPGIEQTEVHRVIGRCLAERKADRLLNRFEFPDGSAGWFDLRLSPVELGVLILSVDVTRERAALAELERSQADLATTLACMADAVITTGTDGLVTSLNPAAVALCRCTPAQAVGRPLADTVRIEARPGHPAPADPAAGLLAGELAPGSLGEFDLVAGDGGRTAVDATGALLRGTDGVVGGVVLVFRDMTAELALTRRLEEGQRLESVGRLAGGIAHDFNNMLTVIGGYCSMAAAEGPGGVVGEGLEEIGKAAARATELTRQLLAFSRRQVLQPRVLDLNGIVEDLDRMLRRTLGEDVDLVTVLADDLGPVEVDPVQVEQVVVNLALNARDAMPAGGQLTIETRNVELDAAYAREHAEVEPGPHVLLAVSDTGEGIPPEVMPHLFEPFFSTKALGKGTGLGLATVYGVVRQSGGHIWAYSEPGHGSTFKLYFPRAGAPVAPRRAEPARGPEVGGDETILLVEDEHAVRRLIKRVLAGAGYEVLTAGRAEEALELCRAHGDRIGLLLTDVVLPGRGGRELAEAVQAGWPHVRIVYMSGYTDNAIVHRGVLDAGTAFIAKPIRPTDLLRSLRGYLDAPPPHA